MLTGSLSNKELLSLTPAQRTQWSELANQFRQLKLPKPLPQDIAESTRGTTANREHNSNNNCIRESDPVGLTDAPEKQSVRREQEN